MSESEGCCICGVPVPPPRNVVGGRVYCDRHYATINKPHAGAWRAGLAQIVGMALFSALVAALASRLGPLGRAAQIAFGLVLGLVPSLLWIGYFYRQDRLEPEPKTRLAAVFLLAALLTEALGRRVMGDWFGAANWASGNAGIALLASILIDGFVLQATVYAAVRAIVYATPEFDERMDGIVYGTVAALGAAAVLNVHYVLDNGGVAPVPGVIQTATTALALASFGGLLGYFMAEGKFRHRPVWWLPFGMVLTAALNGLLRWLLGEVSVTGLTVQPWRSLALGLVVALVAFGVLVALMRRSTAVTLTGVAPDRARNRGAWG